MKINLKQPGEKKRLLIHLYATSLMLTFDFMCSSPEVYTIYNVDVVHRIFEYFLMHEQQQQHQQVPGKPSITKLLDNYLAEIAKDPYLHITKFQVLAEVLPENAWKCHDGLYRAIDMFLKVVACLLVISSPN